MDWHEGGPHLRFAFTAARICGGLRLRGFEGEVREGLCGGVEQSDERRSVRSRLKRLRRDPSARRAAIGYRPDLLTANCSVRKRVNLYAFAWYTSAWSISTHD